MFFNTDFLKNDEIYLKCYKTAESDEARGFLPCYYFKIHLTASKEGIGFCDLRVGHNENSFYGGNIGYSIDESHKGNHYAAKAVMLLLELAKMHDMKYVIITSDPMNIGSYKTIERCGGILLGVWDIPKHHEMYSLVRTKTKRYKILL